MLMVSPEYSPKRYREVRQHRSDVREAVVTLVADLGGEIVGFVDAALEQSPHPMHRKTTGCEVAEIAVSRLHQNRGNR